jgi:predicted permease
MAPGAARGADRSGERAEGYVMSRPGRSLRRLALRLVPRPWRREIDADLDEEAAALSRGESWRLRQTVGAAWELNQARAGDAVMFDVRYALRSLWHAKGFAAAAIVTFALGIGLNVAVFSVIDRLMFRPLPFAAPDRLVHVHNGTMMGAAPAPLLDRRVAARIWQRSQSVGELAFARGSDSERVIEGFGEAPLRFAGATANLLDVLGIRPTAGRGFTADAERPPGGATELLLTDAVWSTRFGRSPEIVGRTFGSGGDRYQVVGILPRDFVLPSSSLAERTDGLQVVRNDLADAPLDRLRIGVAVMARLEPGVTLDQARAEIDTLLAELVRDLPEGGLLSAGAGVRIQPLQDGLFFLHAPYLRLIVAAVAVVLLLACANLATLLLARGRSQAHETAMRVALGASTRRLVAAAALNATILCLASGAVALLTCWWIQSALVAVVPPIFRGFVVSALDPRLVALTFAAAFACALVASIAPALGVRRADPIEVLQRREKGNVGGRLGGGAALLTIEAALGIVLVAGAGATGRSFIGLAFGDPGFVASDLHIITFNRVPGTTGTPAGRLANARAVLDLVGALPGVRSAGVVTLSPVGEGFPVQAFWRAHDLEGRDYGITPHVFEALGTPVLAGRAFTNDEVSSGAPVAILNERGARALWPDQPAASALGRTIETAGGPHTVVGIVRDIRQVPSEPALPSLFLPFTDMDAQTLPLFDASRRELTSVQVPVRMDSGHALDRTTLEARAQAVASGVSVSAQAVEEELAPWLEQPRFQALLFGALAAASLVLAAVGLFAVAAFDVAQRRYEMGVRMALGATARDIGQLVVGKAVRPVLVGAAAGLAVTWWAAQYLQSFLVDVDARDPGTFGVVALVLVATAVVAAWLPARRAARTDPASVLRAV